MKERNIITKPLMSQKGLTVMEVLLAAAILGIALLAIAEMFPTAYQTVSYGGQITRASALAQKMVEMIKGEPSFDNVLLYNNIDTRNPSSIPEASPPPGINTIEDPSVNPPKGKIDKWADEVSTLPGGWGTVSVPSPGGTNNRLATVTVTVGWSGSWGTRTVQMVTMIAEDT